MLPMRPFPIGDAKAIPASSNKVSITSRTASNWRVERRRGPPPPSPPPPPPALPLVGGAPPPAEGAWPVAANAAADAAPTPTAARLPVFPLLTGVDAAAFAPIAPVAGNLAVILGCGDGMGKGIGIGSDLGR